MRVNELRSSDLLRWARWLPAAVWMAIIFYLSHQSNPAGTGPSVEPFLAHIVFYAVLGVLLFAALAGRTSGKTLVLPAFLAIALATLYGASDEVHQAFVEGRTASEWDLAADAAGAILGIGMAFVTARQIVRRS